MDGEPHELTRSRQYIICNICVRATERGQLQRGTVRHHLLLYRDGERLLRAGRRAAAVGRPVHKGTAERPLPLESLSKTS